MSEFSDYTENELLDHLLGEGARSFTSPAALYIALLTATAADNNTGTTITEPSTGGYARSAVSFAAASGGSAAMSDATLTWTNTAATAWSVVGVACCDATTAGNMLFYDNDMADATLNQNDVFKLTDLTVSLD